MHQNKLVFVVVNIYILDRAWLDENRNASCSDRQLGQAADTVRKHLEELLLQEVVHAEDEEDALGVQIPVAEEQHADDADERHQLGHREVGSQQDQRLEVHRF